MRVLIALVVFLCATSCISVADSEEAGELRMDKKLRERNGRYDVTELRKLAAKGRWAKYAGNPVLKPGANGEWDSWTLATVNVLKVGDTCHMYYEAGRKGVIDFQIGHAVSLDGIHWVKDPMNPVIPFGEHGEWDDTETWDPFVLYEDGIFKMWYGGTTVLKGRRDFQIGYATSRDGTHFTKRGQTSHYARGNVGDMHVVHDEQSGKYYMYYLDRNYRPSTLLRAESPNEIGFDFDNAVCIEVEGEENGYRCPHVFLDSSAWYMYYGFKHKKRAGYATSADGLHWNVQIGKWNCFPCFMPDVISREIKRYHKDGIRGVFLCGIGQQLDYYLYTQTAFDVDTDYQELVDEFFALYFGGASEAMKTFYYRISEINREEGLVGTSLEQSWGKLGTPERMKELGVYIDEAVKLAKTDLEKRRVETWKKGVWEYMNAGHRQFYSRAKE